MFLSNFTNKKILSVNGLKNKFQQAAAQQSKINLSITKMNKKRAEENLKIN